MKSLKHSGVYVPKYSPKGYSIIVNGKELKLNALQEEMAVAWCKKLNTKYVEDKVFKKNFFSDFCNALGIPYTENIDFSEIVKSLEEEKQKKATMSKEEKKREAQERKSQREKLKSIYGIAYVDDKPIEIQNWACEPSSIYISKGANPLRGKWKEGPKEEDITLNLSPDSPVPPGSWKEVVWKPDKMFIASWKDKLTGKMKYIWFSPASEIRQNREKKKFDIAATLEEKMPELEKYIEKELRSKDKERRKLATAVYLMKTLAIRVGDEKIYGEKGTVGCTTLKAENIKLEKNNKVILDFIGKDYVKWHRELTVPPQVYQNLKEFREEAKQDFLFKGLDSNRVSKFLREKIPGLSAKVFRTYMAGKTWDESAKENLKKVKKDTPLFTKKFLFKMTNLAVAKKLNHKKALPNNYQERLQKKEEQLRREEEKLKKMSKPEKIITQKERIEKIKCELELLKETAEWNLNTSLNSYIDPRKVLAFMKKAHLSISDIYTSALQKKYSWALGEVNEEKKME